MKLELKHLAGYLPYGLKGISTEENLGIEIVKGYSIYGKNDTICLATNVDDIDLELFKPILRPLSDLTKEDLHIFSVDFRIAIKSGDKFYVEHYITLSEAEWLYENHFDIYGLIKNNLAIDINTLNKIN